MGLSNPILFKVKTSGEPLGVNTLALSPPLSVTVIIAFQCSSAHGVPASVGSKVLSAYKIQDAVAVLSPVPEQLVTEQERDALAFP